MKLAQNKLRLMGLALLVMILFFACGAAAQAASDPIDFTIQVSPQSLTEPGNVQVSLRVANTGEKDMVDPVTLYDPAGNVVASFGDGGSYILSAGAFRTWEGTWNVTQAQLDAGQFAYSIRYNVEDEEGSLISNSMQAVARVEYAGERINLEVKRQIAPEVVRSGGQASAVYELYNSGNVDLTDIRVKENISRNAQTVKRLPAGERTTLTFTAKMGNADLKSNASITYKAVGSTKTLTEKVDDATIPLAKPGLKMEVSSPVQGVNIGEEAILVVTFTNNGNISYSNVTVKDEKKGDFLTNLSIPAGATVTEQKGFILLEPTTFKVSATLPDNTGNTNTMKASEVTVGVYDPEKTLLLTLNLTCEQESIHETPADVRFHLTVTNNSNIKAENITISHGDVNIYTISSLEPGASTVLTRDVRVSQAGKFRFSASLKDSMQNIVTFDSNTVQLIYARPTQQPTQVPVVTVAPPVEVTAAPADPVLFQARSALMTLGAALAILFGVGLLLFAVSTGIRLYKKGKSNAAYDHLELAERRDYTEPADEDLDDADAPAEDTVPAELSDETFTLPHEKLVKPLVQSQEPNAPAEEDMPAADGEGGYRVTRIDVPENDIPDPIPQEPQAAPEASGEEGAEASASAGTPRRRRSQRAHRTEDGE